MRITRWHVDYDYSEYLGSDYKVPTFPWSKPDKKVTANTIIANHSGMLDSVLFMGDHMPMFLAKAEILKIPIYSEWLRYMKSIFVMRDANNNQRWAVIEAIKERQWERDEGKYSRPLCVYPEGMSSNNEYLLPFKKGAFVNLSSTQPYCLKY